VRARRAGCLPIGSGQRRGAAVHRASSGLVTGMVSVSSLDWAACRVAQAGRVLAAGGRLVLVDLYAIGYLRVLCTLARCPGGNVRFPDRAEHGIRLLEEDMAMSDRIPAAGDADNQRGSEPDLSATDEFAKMRAVMRASEKHREGGVDPDLEVVDADPGPDT
jgi:hypothetical protein